jgi:hypothetical protein
MAHLCLRQVDTSFRTPPSPRAYLTPADPSEADNSLGIVQWKEDTEHQDHHDFKQLQQLQQSGVSKHQTDTNCITNSLDEINLTGFIK